MKMTANRWSQKPRDQTLAFWFHTWFRQTYIFFDTIHYVLMGAVMFLSSIRLQTYKTISHEAWKISDLFYQVNCKLIFYDKIFLKFRIQIDSQAPISTNEDLIKYKSFINRSLLKKEVEFYIFVLKRFVLNNISMQSQLTYKFFLKWIQFFYALARGII